MIPAALAAADGIEMADEFVQGRFEIEVGGRKMMAGLPHPARERTVVEQLPDGLGQAV